MAMQDYFSDYFTYVEKKATREQLLDLSIAQEAKKRLDAERPFLPFLALRIGRSITRVLRKHVWIK